MNENDAELILQNRSARDSALVIDQVSSEYSELARTLIGPNDDPRAWIEGLKRLLVQIKDVSE